MGAGFADDEFLDEVVSLWDVAKSRRQRPLDLATVPRTKMPRLENLGQGIMVAAQNTMPMPDSENDSSMIKTLANMAAYFRSDDSEE